ncbi:tyrosine-type recombinase/integrase [Microbacterium oxydans]|uniref:tyrosine-type recombinase/integrase n=1 Tax=Microbacterium oxydans TaxID=82380 RepID=UPI000F8F9372|nr:tyrosine-type recombinase/integrase [Microbacterium oxydans]AZS48809.1 Putative prophage phiRv2 integrase [Microbacterium oxydans]
MPEKWHLPIRVAFGAHLRVGELEALQRGDYANGAVRVERQRIYVRGQGTITPTKTGEARTVVLPPSIAAEVEAHLANTTGFPKSPMFPRRDGEAITGNALSHAWRKAARGIGLGQFHVHDLRHAGLTLAAQAGGTTRELMARAGHRTARAALIYQHAAEERNAVLAGAMDVLAGSVVRTHAPRLEAVLRLEMPGT